MPKTRTPHEPATTGQPLIDLSGRRAWGWLPLVVLTLVATLSATDLSPPAPEPDSAPIDKFSAARAADHLPGLADQPRPIGTPQGDRARDRLVSELQDLGLDPQVQTAWAASPLRSGNDGAAMVGLVDNVVAVIPGSDPTGRVFLVAHYDTTMNSPGAADNGAAVVAILETIRALQAGPAPRNDLVVVFTDGEEPGLLGAEAFTREHPLAQGGGVALNLEAGGSHGTSTVFQTSTDNSCLIQAYAAVPHPAGDSATATFFELTSHNTDLSLFTEAGIAGLSTGFFRGTATYHTPQDSVTNLSPASLQHHGANLLRLTQIFGASDLGTEASTECGDVVFFTALGGMVRYPAGLTLPLAGLGLLGVVGAVVVGRRRGTLTLPRTLVGFGAALVPILLSSVATHGLWQLLVALRPGYADLGMGDPYRAEFYRLAVIGLTATLVIGWYASLRRHIGPASLALGAVLWPALAGLATAWIAPGASFLFTLPTLGAGLGILAALAAPPSRWWWRLAALTIGAVATVFFLPQLAWDLLASSGGIASGSMVAPVLAVLAVALLPLVELLFPVRRTITGTSARRRLRNLVVSRGTVLVVALALVSGSFAGTGLVVDRFDAQHPRPSHLHYVLDTDTQTATWISRDQQPSDWTCGFVDCGPDPEPGPSALTDSFPWVDRDSARTGAAASASLDAPVVTVLDNRTKDDSRIVQLRLQSPRGAAAISLYVDQRVTEATVAGLSLHDVAAPARGRWAFGLEVHSPPAEGVIVTLRLANSDAAQIRVVDHSYGLTGLPGFTSRPVGVGVAMAPSDVVSVGRTLSLRTKDDQ